VVAALLALTALAVIVPVAIQVLRREYRPGQAWPHLLVAAGMLVVAAAYGLFEGATQGILAVLGLIAALLGMLALQRRP
jgi:hypothetical protein